MTESNPDPLDHSPGSTPDAAGNGTTKQKFSEDAKDVQRDVTAAAREQAEVGQHRLADGADALSEAIDAAASNLDEHDREGMARYARELSSKLANAAGHLEGRSVDELATDAKRLARNNPALFMLGSIAVGFGLSRFFKADAERDHHDADDTHQKDAHWHDGDFRDEDVSSGTSAQRREQGLAEANITSTSPHNGDGRDLQ